MAVQFIIGRAGSGKTYHCLEAVRTQLSADPIHGPRLILLVPEQASFQTEHALIVGKGVGVMHRAEVLSFQRLAYRILDHAGVSARNVLSGTARAMVLRHLIGTLAGQLVYYRRVERFSGFLNRLGETIQEMIQELVTPDQLRIDAAAAGSPARAEKLADLSLLYRAYLDYLGEEWLDPSQLLELARRYAARCEWLNGAHVWVDGFAGFTRQERALLCDMASRAAQTCIALLADPDAVERSAPPEPWDLFGKTLRTYQRLRNDFAQTGLEIGPPLVLRSASAPRFSRAASLAKLERTLFTLGSTGRADSAPARRDVEIVELPTRRLEADYAVARICDAVRQSNGTLRYRQVGIIVRDLAPYDDLLTAALTDRGVPFFIDRRRSIAHHPLVEWLRSMCLLAAEELSVEAVRLALKTALLGLSSEDADELENYILAHGIAGPQLWQSAWSFQSRKRDPDSPEAGARINSLRQRFLVAVAEWLRTAGVMDSKSQRDAGRTLLGTGWASALQSALQRLHVGEQVETWAAQAEDDGDLDQAAEHRQAWRDIGEFLAGLEAVLGETPLTIGELAAVIDAGLSQLTLGLTPPMLDQVLVGGIERSRHPELRLVMLLGFNDGVFPRSPSEDTILNDDDRTALIAGGAEVTPPRRQRALEEALLAYVACTRASERLIITFAAADENGKALRPSPFIEAIRSACSGLAITRCPEPIRQRATWSIHSPNDLAGALAAEFRHRPDEGSGFRVQGSELRVQASALPVRDVASPPATADVPLAGGAGVRAPGTRSDATDVRRVWNALYERVRADSELIGKLRRALSALHLERSSALSAESVARLFPGTFTTSVSRLEAFAACPFKHFAQYELKLQERELAELEPVDVGKVHHAILEDFIGQLVERGRTLHDLADGDVIAELEASCQRVGQILPRSGALSQAREVYLLKRSPGEVRRVIQAQRHVSRGGHFRPRKMELRFGFGEGDGLPAVEITTPDGRAVSLRGVIDRVDLAELADEMLGIVIDYKRTRDKRLNLAHVYHGLSLQLVAYLLALAERGESLAGRPIRPVGAFYISLYPQYKSVVHPDDYDEEQALTAGPYRPRGVLDADAINVLDANYSGQGRSTLYNFSRNKDGAIGNLDRSDSADRAAFEGLLNGVRRRLGELADHILDGDIRVAPYRLRDVSPCKWCSFGAVCRFEHGQDGMRFLQDLKRTEVFAKLTVRGGSA